MLMFAALVIVLASVVIGLAYLMADHLGYMPRRLSVVDFPRSEIRKCQGCGRDYHESWEEPEPLPGEEDLRGLGPCCTGAD